MKSRIPGSVKQRGKNSWRLTISDGYDSKGNRIRYTRTVKTDREKVAYKELAKFYSEVARGEITNNSNITFSELTERWYKTLNSRAAKTKLSYRSELDSRILPALGHLKVKKIKPYTLEKFYSNLHTAPRLDKKAGGLSTKTIYYQYRIINCILNKAVKWDIITRNPNKRVEPPKVQKKIVEAYNEEQIMQLTSALEKVPLKYQVFINLVLATGMRRGEALALQWSDVDFKNKTITINKSAQYIPSEGVSIKTTKNNSSTRANVIPESVIPILEEFRKVQQARIELLAHYYKDSGYIFTQDNGTIMHPSTISNWFRKFIRKHNLPKINIHGLRHTTASYLINSGIDIKSVSKRLGHARTSTTLNIYAHAYKQGDIDAANKLDSLLKGD